MEITRLAFWGMLAVAGIEIYELVRYGDDSLASALMLLLSLGAAAWLYLGEKRSPSGG